MQAMQEIRELEAVLSECFGPDRPRLRRALARLWREWKRLRRGSGGEAELRARLAGLAQECSASRARVAQRMGERPRLEVPTGLPIAEHAADIARALESHQVVIVCGETGSGKTTQLPKFCLSLGRGARGLIGHTQPRRIAARSVTRRLGEELQAAGAPAAWVGYKVRFHDRTRAETRIKLMTDGILLAEIQQDRLLETYDTLIIDEAHERSLNIDFLLGYLRRILPRRPDLKLIVTSATIDPQAFARHFGEAPVIEVSGRSHPVEIRYRPPEETAEGDLQQAILQAVDELAAEGPGDILVFLSGERDIRETAEALRKHHPPGTEILPLYARLSAAEQDRVFRPHGGRRIVLATNVAETSLTVPGIRYVVDTGLARISRYSPRSKVQRLPIEPISQAAARQRAGRCGREAPGICIRLYSEADYDSRPPFTPPEILRTNLASVILQMKQLRLGELEHFPFLDPPDGRQVRDGLRLLRELQALDDEDALTPLGRRLARLPLDPRLGRMVLAGAEFGCLREVLVIASALSIQDPRERPADKRAAADAAHAAYQDPRSDFLAWLKLWEAVETQRRRLSRRRFRRFCQERFLSCQRLDEWRDIHQQLYQQVREMGLQLNEQPPDYAALHKALLSGLLGQVAMLDERPANGKGRAESRKGSRREYLGARGARLRLFPTSGLADKPPKWIVAAEWLETSSLYGVHAAAIEPEWLEELAPHLLQRQYEHPHWVRRRARVMAFERTTLYGLVIHPRRRVAYDAIDPEQAHEIFLQALARGEYAADAPFARHNRALLDELLAVQDKLRRRFLVDETESLLAFYRQRIPVEICDGRSFERWRREVESRQPRLLYAERSDLAGDLPLADPATAFPDHLEVDGVRLPLEYHFAPGESGDGLTVVIPLPVLMRVRAAACEWLVPGLRHELILALIKSLPKSLRRNFVPAAEFAAACAEALAEPTEGDVPTASPDGSSNGSQEGSLQEALAQRLQAMTGVAIPADAWRPERLPVHLRPHYRLVDEQGRTLAEGDDLARLQQEWADAARAAFRRLLEGKGPAAEETEHEEATGGQAWERRGIQRWDFGDLPPQVTLQRGAVSLTAYPALTDEGDGKSEGVCLRTFETPQQAAQHHRRGVRRLLGLQLREELAGLAAAVADNERLCRLYAPLGSRRALQAEYRDAVLEQAFLDGTEAPRRQATFEALLEAGKRRLHRTAEVLARFLEEVLERHHRLHKRLQGPVPPAWLPAFQDMRGQLERLIFPGFLSQVPQAWLRHYPRYLEAMERRLQKLHDQPARDLDRLRQIQPLWQACLERYASDPQGWQASERRWLLEELRVSLFAQELKTARRVSLEQLKKVPC